MNERQTHPTWLRVILVLVQIAAVAGGILIGNATYERWSEPGEPETTTTTTIPQTQPVPADTLG